MQNAWFILFRTHLQCLQDFGLSKITSVIVLFLFLHCIVEASKYAKAFFPSLAFLWLPF
jgi:hypothetical protein